MGALRSGEFARIGDADPQWVQEQVQLENDTRATLQDLINQLLATIPPS
ncbi:MULTISPECIES: hypothetical protein [unclassified Mycobacterium]|nr:MULTISPECIES: hypothetical protein [unclassified Mycobacterium]